MDPVAHEGVDVSGTSLAGLRERSLMVAALTELLALGAGLITATASRNLESARNRVAEDRFNLVVLGEFKRGKSTLINALLRRDVLPVGVVPLTSVVTTIGSGDRDRLLICYRDGRQQECPLDELAAYVTEARNPENRLGVEIAQIELDHELLGAGIELVDTPGIGSIHDHNTAVAREFLPRVDAAICVLDAGQPLSEAERELFREARRRVPRLLMVVNKIDHLDQADREVAIQFVQDALRDLLDGESPEVFAVSARRQEGMKALRARVRRLANEEREHLLLRSVAGLARGFAADTAQAARFEMHAIELPLADLTSRAWTFEERIVELRAASADARDLLERGTRRALDESVNVPLKTLARHEQARLVAALHDHVEQLPRCSPRELAVALERWTDTTVRSEFEQLVPRFETTIADQLTELERRYATRVQEILERVQETAENIFGTRASDVMPDTGLRAPSRFSFKLRDVEHALDIIVGFGRTITPGTLGRRFVIRDAEERLIIMMDRHAGRLRSELAERSSAASRKYQNELAATVEEAIDAIRRAVVRATEERQAGEQHAQARLAQLEQTARRCTKLAQEFERWS